MQNEGKEQSEDKKTVFVVRLTAIGDTLIAARSVLTLIESGFEPVFCTSRACSDIALCIPGLRYVAILENDRSISTYTIVEDNGLRKFDSTELLWQSATCSKTKVPILDLQNTRRSWRFIKLIGKKLPSCGYCVTRVRKHSLARIALVARARLSFNQKSLSNSESAFTPPSKLRRVAHNNFELVNKFLQKSGKQQNSQNISTQKLVVPRVDVEDIPLPYMVLCPGASLPLKAWGAENYRTCAENIIKNSEAHIVILGGPDELAVGKEIAAINDQRVHNRVAKFSLLESLAVISKAEYLIAGDSFPGHACDILGVPATILFGATSPYFGFSPCSSNIRVRWLNLNCSPCTRHGRGLCRFKNHLCMKNIAATDVSQDFLTSMHNRKLHPSR